MHDTRLNLIRGTGRDGERGGGRIVVYM
jgi:hypothetical protein